MGSMTIEIEYPCGYKYSFYIKGWGLQIKADDVKLSICPIHKDKCKKEMLK